MAHDYPSSAFIPAMPSDESDDNLRAALAGAPSGAREPVEMSLPPGYTLVHSNDLSALTKAIKDIRSDLHNVVVSINSRMDAQDSTLKSLQQAHSDAKHALAMAELEKSYEDSSVKKRLEEHSGLVKAIGPLQQKVDAHEALVQSLTKAKNAVLLNILEKIGSYLIPALVTLAVMSVAREKLYPPDPAPAPVAQPTTVKPP